MKKLIKATFIFSLFLVISSCSPGEAESENQNSNPDIPSIQQSSDNLIKSSFDSISSEETPHEHTFEEGWTYTLLSVLNLSMPYSKETILDPTNLIK